VGYNDSIILGDPGKYDIDHGVRVNGMNIAIAGGRLDGAQPRRLRRLAGDVPVGTGFPRRRALRRRPRESGGAFRSGLGIGSTLVVPSLAVRKTTPAKLPWLAAAALLAAVGCRSGDFGAAAAGLGAGVVTAGVLRATTGTCWARCGPGDVCNRESGLCEAGECYPACPVGQSCARELDGSYRCADDPTVFRPGAATTSPAPAASAAPAPSAAPATLGGATAPATIGTSAPSASPAP